jgi:hypothetical protein
VKTFVIILLVFVISGCGSAPEARTAMAPRPEPRAQPKVAEPFNLQEAQRALETIRFQLAALEDSIEVEDYVSIAVSFGSIVEAFEKMKRLSGPGGDQQAWEETHEQGIAMAIRGTEAALSRDVRGVSVSKESITLWIQREAYGF